MSLKHYVNVSHFVVDTDSHFVVDTDSHFVVDTDSHFVVDTESHFVADNNSHFVVDTDSHFVVDTESHFVADNDSHFVVDTDSHFNVFKSECLRILNASLKRLFCVVWSLEYRIFIIAKLRLALHFKSSRSRKIAALTKCSLKSDWVKLAATASPV